MNLIQLLHALNDQVESLAGSPPRHIVRFHHTSQYKKVFRQWSRMKTALPQLSSAQPLPIIHALACTLRNKSALDPYRSYLSVEENLQISMRASALLPMERNPPQAFRREFAVPWGVKRIQAPLVWGQSTGSRIKIGVIDTGADHTHPDLRFALGRGVNLVHRHAPPFDDNGHGTHICGTIAASSGGRSGITGVAPRALVYPIKAFDHNGTAYVSDIVQGINWSVANRMHIINMSFGMKSRSSALYDAVTNAYRSGVVIVASSGNDGKASGVDYPAKFRTPISVGATNRKRRIAPFSNRGKLIDLYAPGESIYSTWLGGKYNELSGTSMATAHVSGVIALMLAVSPGLRPHRIKSLLKQSALPTTRSKTTGAAGQVNAYRALQLLKS